MECRVTVVRGPARRAINSSSGRADNSGAAPQARSGGAFPSSPTPRGEPVASKLKFKFKVRPKSLLRTLGKVTRFLIVSRLLGAFVALCTLGVIVGIQARPDPKATPWGELFDHMRVVSYRESPADSTARFLVELSDG